MATTEVHTIEAGVHGRYLIRPANAEGPAPLLAGFHGYAETAEENLDQLLELSGLAHWHIISIQALHPFYRSRLGDLGASWMTRQDRELAIVDNTRYVGLVLSRLHEQLDLRQPLALVGFSQGTAMAYRAAAGSGQETRGLIALGGDVPTDILERDLSGFPRVLIGRGTEDKHYDAAKMDRDVDLLGTAGIEPETCVFEGGHEWSAEFYRAAGRFLASLEEAEKQGGG